MSTPPLKYETKLIVALSGLGKTTLAQAHPLAWDADDALYDAVASGFPELEERERLVAWRTLFRSRPWERGGEPLERWARVRRQFNSAIVQAMRQRQYKLVLTSLLDPPWVVWRHYGVERGRYLEHLHMAGRNTDNLQNEAMNERLEGYAPLVRLPPGTFLGSEADLNGILAL